jgi:hypothetical protein
MDSPACGNVIKIINQKNMEKEIKPIKSGVIIEPLIETDWSLGSSGLAVDILEDGDWTQFLPSNEKQRRFFESMSCTNFSSTTAVEIIFTYLIKKDLLSKEDLDWLSEKGYFDENGNINFSDRYDAIGSGTNPNSGNTLKAPADFKHKYGLIPEKMLSWTDDEDAYFDKKAVTPAMLNLGQEFIKRFPINYEFAYESQIKSAYKKAPLAGACFAWPDPENGVYPANNYGINHAICRIKPTTNQKIMDSYEPFVKTLADDYKFMNYSIVYIVGYKKKPIEENPENTNEINPNNSMIKTIKFDTTPEVYLQSNTNPKILYWIGNENTFNIFKEAGWIGNWEQIEILNPALKPTYDIRAGMVVVTYVLNALIKALNFLGLGIKK